MKITQYHAMNQFKLEGSNFNALQSYDSMIVLRAGGKTYLGNNWDYSVTTGKYRNKFLYETKPETQKKIDAGIYKRVDLDNPDVFAKLVKSKNI